MTARQIKQTSIALFLVTVIFFFPSASSAKSFNTIIAFGDSLTDHYGLQSYIGPYDPVSNPTGALDSWTNGDVWGDYLANVMQADLNNHAIAGAMTKGHENDSIQALSDVGQLPQLGLVGQVALFTNDNTGFPADKTLFTIWIGGNDLLKFGRGESDAASMDELITSTVNNIIQSMIVLANDDAQYFLVLNLPDLGKTPAYNTRSAAEIAAATSLSFAFNSALKTGLANFKDLFPDATVYTFDVFNYLNEIIADHVFKNSTGTYMVLDAEGNRTGETNEPASDYLFWDSIHPTTKAHKMVATEVADTVLNADNDDDDNSCFISSSTVAFDNQNVLLIISGLIGIIGITGLIVKQ